MSHSTKIADLLGTIIEEADDKLKQELAQALEDFAEKRPLAFISVQKTPYSQVLMDAMIVASDARVDPALLDSCL